MTEQLHGPSSSAMELELVVAWLNRPEGRQSIEASLREAQQTINELNDARAVHPHTLHDPVTF